MSVQYRLLQADEQEAVLTLWVEVFPGTNRAQWEREFVWDQQRFAHTYVAVDATGSLLATMRYLLREVRGLAGERYRTSWLTNVATKPNAQRRGYGRQLLARTLEAMQQEGCTWSLLTADTTAQGFYARYGWRAFPLRYQQGLFTDQEIARTRRYQIRPYDPDSNPQGWEALAAVYDDYNASRPLTTVRDTAYWQGYGQMRLREWLLYANATIFVAEPVGHPEKPVGYVLAHFSELGLLITEAATQAHHDDALPELIQAVVDKMTERGLPAQGRVHLPHDTRVDSVLQRLFGSTLHSGSDSVMMAQSLAGHITDEVVDAIFAAPSAICWPLDDY
jgi:GNAT superfamily N-acetyltransferase